jgi:SulP family sulfate permease
MKKKHTKIEKQARKDLFENMMAGLTVSFVALSLGAAFGILSGRGAFAGMLSSALIAIVTSLFGGTRIQCSGPTGPMTAVTAVLVAAAHDEFMYSATGVTPDQAINVGILLGGALMVFFGVLGLGKYITLIPNVVISGFMNGIAIIIWLDQMKQLFGLGGKEAIAGPLAQNVFLAVVSFSSIFFFQWFMKRYVSKLASLFSGTLLTLFVMTIVAYVFFPAVERVELSGALRSFADVTTLLSNQFPTEWTVALLLFVLPFSFKLAILGYLDTLMTALVIDKMTKEKTRPNQELAAQGFANGLVSFVGGIPGAQATIRSVLMVKEKATMRLAGVLVGVFALLEIVLFQDVVNSIPQAVFVGVLIKVGYDVFDWLPVRLYIREMQRGPALLFKKFFSNHPKDKIYVTNREMIMILGTSLFTVFFDLNFAVAVFTVLFYLHNNVFVKHNPMRDLNPVTETELFRDED